MNYSDFIYDFNLYLCERFGYRNCCSVMHNANGICVSVHVGKMDLYIRFWDFQLWDYVNIFKKIEAKKTAMGYIMQDHLQQNTIALADNKNITDRFEELAPPILNQIIALRENHKFDKATR